MQRKEIVKIKILDASKIDPRTSVFSWASFQAREGGIKLHTIITI